MTMTCEAVERQLRELISGEFSSIHVEYNPHACNYTRVADACAEGIYCSYEDDEWASPEEKQEAIATNSVWRIHWYPNTPVGFHRVCASTLEAAIAAARKVAGL